MKRLLLIHPAMRSQYAAMAGTESWGTPPLSLAYIAALTPDDWDVTIVDEYLDKIDFDSHWDLVGITSYTCTATRAYEISSEFRKKGVTVVMGGIHASFCPEEAMRHVDAVVVGEAESVWVKLIEDLLAGKMERQYVGGNPPIENLPVPRRDLLSDRYQVDAIQTTRGCPFDCEFCSVTAIAGRKYRSRPVGEVLDELATLKKRIVFFTDDNFFGQGKKCAERAIEICKGMIERGIKKSWFAQTSLNIVEHPEVLEWAAKAGCMSLYVGIESILPENLKAMNKVVNYKQQIEGIKDSIRTIHRHGMAVVGAMFFGYGADDISVFQRTLDFIEDSGLDVAHVGILTPYPGTKLRDRMLAEGTVLYLNYPDDWDLYDVEHIVVRFSKLTSEDMLRGFDYLSRRLYSKWGVFRHALRTLIRTRKLMPVLASYSLNRDCTRPQVFERQFKRAVREA